MRASVDLPRPERPPTAIRHGPEGAKQLARHLESREILQLTTARSLQTHSGGPVFARTAARQDRRKASLRGPKSRSGLPRMRRSAWRGDRHTNHKVVEHIDTGNLIVELDGNRRAWADRPKSARCSGSRVARTLRHARLWARADASESARKYIPSEWRIPTLVVTAARAARIIGAGLGSDESGR